MKCKIWKTLRDRMLSTPFCTLSEEQGSLSFEETVIYVEAFAARLSLPCYGILCHSEMAASLALLSCFAAGVTAVPLSLRYGEEHCRSIIKKMKIPALITDGNGILKIERTEYLYQAPSEGPALILSTSGTTGHPKGIMLSEDNILSNLLDIADYFKIGHGDSILIARPLYHGAVLTGEFLISLFKGVNIVFYSAAFSPAAWLSEIRNRRITVLGGTPTVLTMLARFAHNEKLPLRHIVVSGECLHARQAKKLRQAFFDADIYSVYGLSEASPRVSYLPPSCFDTQAGSVGIPLRSVEMCIVDENGYPVEENTEGELIIKGPNVMLGYFDDPALTERTVRNGWLYTGDCAYRAKGGFYYICGRTDDMIIRAGMNIYPAQIENALLEDERVEDVLVYGYDAQDVRGIGLKVKGRFQDIAEVYSLCVRVLPDWELPTHIEIVKEISRNATGKKRRKE